jgi:hypothetical protein
MGFLNPVASHGGYQLVLYVDVSFYNTTKFFKNITLHIKLKYLLHRTGLQTSYFCNDAT